MPRLSEAEKTDRRERILDGARRCFARHGYEGATVVRLEEEIGLSRGAIFNWFPSKEELFIALAARDNERLLLLFAEEGLEGILDALLGDDPDWLAVYLEFGRRLRADADLRKRWETIAPETARDRSRAWIEDGQAASRLRSDVSVREIGQFLGVIFDGIVVQRALGFDAPDPELLRRLTADAIAERQEPASSSA
ncbi:MAG TPA: TetR/AcrR family transcriptional regulator [Gaiella sp.]|nr:TetR/AcrR family transcriptional regulator [Gaiella sp.]